MGRNAEGGSAGVDDEDTSEELTDELLDCVYVCTCTVHVSTQISVHERRG